MAQGYWLNDCQKKKKIAHVMLIGEDKYPLSRHIGFYSLSGVLRRIFDAYLHGGMADELRRRAEQERILFRLPWFKNVLFSAIEIVDLVFD